MIHKTKNPPNPRCAKKIQFFFFFSFEIVTRKASRLSIQIIRGHQQLQTQLRRNIHIHNVDLLFHLVVVAEVFADFFEDDATIQRNSFVRFLRTVGIEEERETNVMFSRTQVPVNASENLPIQGIRSFPTKDEEAHTARIEHATYRARDTGCAAGKDEFEAIA